MELSALGRKFITTRESCVLAPHWDAVGGVWDIGYGHRFKPGEPRVPITQAEAEALFEIDVHYYSDQVTQLVRVPLIQQQFDSLCSFTYNLGGQALRGSSKLLPSVNGALHAAAVVALLEWNKAKGKKVRGLCNRRYDEAMVYAYGDYSPC